MLLKLSLSRSSFYIKCIYIETIESFITRQQTNVNLFECSKSYNVIELFTYVAFVKQQCNIC